MVCLGVLDSVSSEWRWVRHVGAQLVDCFYKCSPSLLPIIWVRFWRLLLLERVLNASAHLDDDDGEVNVFL